MCWNVYWNSSSIYVIYLNVYWNGNMIHQNLPAVQIQPEWVSAVMSLSGTVPNDYSIQLLIFDDVS